MPRVNPLSLRTVFTIAAATLGTAALIAAVALVAVTSEFAAASVRLVRTLESLRLAQALQADLLTHNRLSSRMLIGRGEMIAPSAEVERALEQRVAELRRRAVTDEERQLIDEIAARVAEYLAAIPPPRLMLTPEGPVGVARANDRRDAAYASLERLVQVRVREAQGREHRVAALTEVAKKTGFAIAALVLVTVAAAVWWVRAAALRPVLAIGEAIRRFGAGDAAARAPLHGPAELEEIANTFNEMAETLAQQREAQLASLAGVAHDLRNPLAALKGALDLVAPKRNPSEERIRQTLGLAGRQIDRLDRMTGDLMEAARIQSGELELELEERDLRNIVRDVVELQQQGAEGERPIELELADEPLLVRCDALRIAQVVENLLGNALKYSPEGSPVAVGARRAGEEIEISVADRGIGIAAEELAHIFQPFRRTPESRRGYPGIGLGLATVKQVIERHGGRIEVESRPQQGTTMRAYLPAVADEPPA